MNEKTKVKIAFIIIALFWIFVIGIFINKSQKNSSKEEPKEVHPAVYNSEWDGSVFQAKQYLMEHLKDPDSYQSIVWYKLVNIKGKISEYPEAAYMVKHKYRSKNSFGGYNIEMATFILNDRGAVIDFKSE